MLRHAAVAVRSEQQGCLYPVATVVLRLVERHIGSREKAFRHSRSPSRSGEGCRRADADRDDTSASDIGGMRDLKRLDHAPRTLCHRACGRGAQLRQDQSQFLAAIPRKSAWPIGKSTSKRCGNGAEGIISDLVPIVIVEAFEVVDVHQQ